MFRISKTGVSTRPERLRRNRRPVLELLESRRLLTLFTQTEYLDANDSNLTQQFISQGGQAKVATPQPFSASSTDSFNDSVESGSYSVSLNTAASPPAAEGIQKGSVILL